MNSNLAVFTDILGDEIAYSQESQPLSLSSENTQSANNVTNNPEPLVDIHSGEKGGPSVPRPAKGKGQYGQFRSVDEIDAKYRSVFSYPFFNSVQSRVIEDALYSDKSMVVCAPTGSGKTVVFEMAIVQLLMELEDKQYTDDFKIIYMAPVKALCTERLTEWYPKFTKLGLMCIEVTGDTDVDFSQLKPYRIIITTPEKWDMVTRRWREHSQLVEVVKLFLIDEVHILNDETRGPVLEAVVSRMKTIESSAQSAYKIEQLQNQYQGTEITWKGSPPRIRFVAVSATVSNPGDVAAWLGNAEKPAVYYKFGDESRPVKLNRVVEGYPCAEGTSIFKFDIILNYKLWPIIQKYHNGKPTLIFCNTRKSVQLTAETLSREITVSFSPEQKAKLTALASTIKNKKLQALVLSGVGCHHAGLLYEERNNIEHAFRNRDLPILITTTTLAMGVNLPAHLVIIKNTQQYVNGAYQEYSISTILQMIGRAGRPQYDTEATAVIMTRLCDKPRYQALVGGSEPLQSYLHKRLAENLNSEAALGTVSDVAQCVQWLRSTFLFVRAARDPKRYLGLPQNAPQNLISKKIEELCVKAMNGLATSGLITMDEASCIESTEAGRLMSIFYLDLETMKHIMKINGSETLERLLWVICESHELADMHLRVDERRCLNALNRNNAAATIRFPMKGKISSRQMKLNCIIQATLGCLNIPEPALNQEAMKIMRIADRVCKCLVAYVTRPALIAQQPKYYSAILNSLVLAKCISAHLWENSPYVSKQLKGIGPTFSTLLATAGKINFMLLEESHPRDLERIMNKGPPAGNVLRKQVILLPKYQLTMTPVPDENTVTVELVLLNQNYLAENMENLTAGNNHKSHVIVGDSENNLLLLKSFMDKDLISIYDGTMTFQITRKHSFEYKIFAHCISSTFVGIDAQCEYLFNGLEPGTKPSSYLAMNKEPLKKPAIKQTTITDTFKERKRKTTSENDIAQSKEKKKRESALLEKFKYLKDSFSKTSQELKGELNKSAVTSNKILQELTQSAKSIRSNETGTESVKPNTSFTNTDFNYVSEQQVNTDGIDCEEFIDDEKINSILNEIESEIISKGNMSSDLPSLKICPKMIKENMCTSVFTESKSTNMTQNNYNVFVNESYKPRKRIQKKTNYNFIDLLERNLDLSQDVNPTANENNGFSDTIKYQIEKYLQDTKILSKAPDRTLINLLNAEHNKDTECNENKEMSAEAALNTSNNEESKLNEIVQNSLRHTSEEVEEINLKDDKIIENHIESENQDENQIEPISTEYNNTEITDLNTSLYNHDIENLSLNRNESPLKNNLNYENDNSNSTTQIDIKRLDNNMMLYNNSGAQFVPGKDVNDEVNKSSNMSVSIHPSITECQTTNIFSLPYAQLQSLTSLGNISGQHNICNAKTDLIKPRCIRQTPINKPEQKQSESSSDNIYNNCTNTSNQNVNVKKYSFSSTQVDITSRNNCETVIRKINVDLDITEIISRENRDYRQQETKTDTNVEKSDIIRNRCKYFKLPEPLAYAEHEEISNVITAFYENNIDKNEGVKDEATEKTNKEIITSPALQLASNSQKTELLARNTKTTNDDDKVANKINKSPQKECKRIESVLQKYSKIFSKNYTENLSQSRSKILDKSLNNTPLKKPNRPFKITDIHHLKTPLPETLISETPKQEIVIEPNKPKEIDYNEKNTLEGTGVANSYSSQANKLFKDCYNTCVMNIDQTEEELTDNDELPHYSLVDKLEPRPTEDFNIDQSMFNPKTILQCLSNDDPDFIPPPPEFCDGTEPVNNDIKITDLMDCYEPISYDFYKNDKTQASAFQDDSRLDLTPKAILETWTLSQNDDNDKNVAASSSFNHTQPFTIMHNARKRNNPFQNVSVTRQNKLKQFKFCRKRKILP